MTEQIAARRDMANAIRALAMDAVQQANSGHPGMPMGMADVATVLFTKFLKFDPSEPHWPDRDRFILSAGHGSMLLYSLLHLTGYADMTLDELKHFRQLGSRTAGHPEYGHASGIETTTGPLGQGLGNSVGLALAERLLAERFGRDVVDHYTYVIAGDGCLMEGVGQEAITLAGHLGLGRLIVLFDDNGISIDGPTSLSTSEDHKKRFAAAGWHVQAVDGHDPDAVAARHPQGAQRRRQALADRLQDDHRLRRADQGGHRRHPRLAARQGRGRGRARRSSAGAIRRSTFPSRSSRPGARSARAASRPGANGPSAMPRWPTPTAPSSTAA